MSGKGEIVPELAALLRKIADRIEGQTADASDATTLRRLAGQAAGKDKRFSVKVHRGRGQRPLGAAGVNRRLAMARAVKDYRAAHPKCSLEDACRALVGEFPGGGQGEDTIENAWQEMSPLLEMSEEQRNRVLFFKRLEARGLAKVTCTKGQPKGA